MDAHRAAGLPDPTPTGPNTASGRELGKLITSGSITAAELKDCLALYLADEDRFLVGNGHALSLLPKRLDAYRERLAADDVPMPTAAQMAEINRIEAAIARGEQP